MQFQCKKSFFMNLSMFSAIFLWFQRYSYDTVWFFPFVIFYDDIISKVIKIFEFWKKFLKAYGDAFYDEQLPGFFYNNLGLGTNMERDVIIFNLFLYKKFSFWLFPFKLLSFPNELSYRFQTGLGRKLFWGSFWEHLR